jgi:hypothetical protein
MLPCCQTWNNRRTPLYINGRFRRKIKFVYFGTGTFGNPDLLIMDEPQ